jgi:hypothetical protein
MAEASKMNNEKETPMNTPNYHAYLLRIWREGEGTPWRGAVVHVLTGELYKFSDPELALAHLKALLDREQQSK